MRATRWLCFHVLLTACYAASSASQTPSLVGYWPLDGGFQDRSGAGHHGQGQDVGFARGVKGQSAAPTASRIVVPSSPKLQLFPGIVIDCWVYFDRQPDTYIHLVHKEQEYQLRVDHPREGGQFAFFMYLEGWEPRIRACRPEAGKWHHLVARWTGTEISLEVDGKVSSTKRVGRFVQTESPLTFGGLPGKIDEVRILNPKFLVKEWLFTKCGAVPDADRLKQAAFGGADGWQGWLAEQGARMTVAEGAIVATMPDSSAVLVNPRLDIPVADKPYVSLDLKCASAQTASLAFITDKGYGETPVHLWHVDRPSILKMPYHPKWRGRLKLLAVSFPEGSGHRARLTSLALSERPSGKPFVYVRNLSPDRAILRVGREERIVAVVRSLGGPALDVEATLSVPQGVELLDEGARKIGNMGHETTDRVEWRIRADRPVAGKAEVVLRAEGFEAQPTAIDIGIKPMPNLRRASYVPLPRPAKSRYTILMHYCPLWKFGTHYGWGKIELWPERKPAIGFYDEGTPEVADWHIKYALEHGVQGFIYCWYRKDLKPTITHNLGHAIHDGLLKARYLDQFKFCIMWENGCAKGVKDRDDLMNNLLPYWMANYFRHPSYLKVDNKPVLFIWVPSRVHSQLDGPEGTRRAFGEMRAACRNEGFEGLTIIGCVGTADRGLLEDMAKAGWDASSAYATWSHPPAKLGRDLEGIPTIPHRATMATQKEVWVGKKEIGALPDIVSVMMGWDPRPWHGPRTRLYQAECSPEHFEAACRDARDVIVATTGNGLDKRMVVLDNWDEFGEGHYLEPCSGFGFSFMDAVRRVFCDDKEPCVDLIPEDVGLDPPDHVYQAYRKILFGDGAKVKRTVTNDLVAWWAFDGDNDHVALDSSTCNFQAFKHRFESVPGVKGKGFRCRGGSVSLEAHDLFFPLTGITVELWLKPDLADQTDKWIISTVGKADTGYRLGLSKGKLMWQIPQTTWSHGITGPETLPLGKWTHVAATYDNETMRLFVDGQEKATRARGGAIHPGRDVCIGNYSVGHTRAFFVGILDEVKVYSRALTPDAARQHYLQVKRKAMP